MHNTYLATPGQSQRGFATPSFTAFRPVTGLAAPAPVPAKTQDWYDILAQLQALYEELLPSWQPAAERPTQPLALRTPSARKLTRDLAGWSLPPVPPTVASRPGS